MSNDEKRSREILAEIMDAIREVDRKLPGVGRLFNLVFLLMGDVETLAVCNAQKLELIKDVLIASGAVRVSDAPPRGVNPFENCSPEERKKMN